jgi:tetratricopeptide (TPR) repeat protein
MAVTTNPQDLQAQGVRLYDQHDFEAAARLFQQAKDAYAAVNQPDMVAEMKVNIGLVHRALGENQQALEMMQEALRTFQEMGDKLRTAQVQGNLGGVYTALNDRDQAHLAYRQAADLFIELGEKKMYAETMLAIGSLQVRNWKFFDGAVSYQLGLEYLETLTPTQKLLKFLSRLITRLSGTPA